MSKQRVLTGITTSGTPHLGNYVGAIRPAIEVSKSPELESFYFMADYHALIKCQDAERVEQSRKEIAATWLALGLNTDNAVFYRQSDIPEIPELNWLLTCMAAKGLMNRAHAYKAAVAANEESGEDPDYGVTMGLYNYPVLMAADILMFNANKVPVGKDQIQHIEMARDIAARFNHHYGDHFQMPEAVIDDKGSILQGLDGRKMSKSYNNTIPLFLTEKQLKKHINKIKTNLLEPGEAKDPDTSTVFQIWEAFASAEQTAEMRAKFEAGIAWGEAKRELFELVNGQLGEAREKYFDLMERPADIEDILQQGAVKARAESAPFIEKLRQAVGLRKFS
ncbi:tryptophan--tRNA ligase [Gilvimarinus agarilyticus]|uniref:tryptophan--tRNA ligase n=1 Tax=Gilvimarinus sp. 2_MG-2023 TaxID=3062666 RepID=UPI001C09AAF4|nr:tryptophan--tRNA ligase [Gilvimarinus sp. 2_MG-2023]MBU2887272.1 tryptophan--tRNA ligase [Gilvimarinus agarilyticus]MDO6571931.1 tryptophan--tRNA ligase [Gilvimarinus sp. 2_MG-2023]